MGKPKVKVSEFNMSEIFDDDDFEDDDFNNSQYDKHKKEITKRRRCGGENPSNALSIILYAVQKKLIKISKKHKASYVKKEFEYLKKIFGFSYNESIICAVLFNGEESRTDMSLYGRLMDMSYLELRQYEEDFKSLEAKEYLYLSSDFSYAERNKEALDSIVKGEKFIHIDRSNDNIADLLYDIRYMYRSGDPVDFERNFFKYYRKYKGHPFFKKLDDLFLRNSSNLMEGSQESIRAEKVMVLFTIQYVFNDVDCISEQNWLDCIFFNYMGRNSMVRVLQSIIDNKDSQNFFRSADCNCFIENLIEDGMANPEKFVLSNEGAKYLGLNNLPFAKSSNNNYAIKKSQTIEQKELFYDDETSNQISRLQELLSEEHFNDIQQRLHNSKMRIGFNILLYGSAGTGKTETCLQLSRSTGRDLYIVGVSDFKNKYVGESEKRIKEIFRTYKEMVNEYQQRNQPIPILLMNEADAIIGIRKKCAEDAVDKMENSIQNIILQEMETINGILIATTNLTENLDSAFERRFIYKIKYSNPSKEAKAKIWKSNMPYLSEDAIDKLSEEFDFSGGEIENIVRKSTIENILSGAEIDYNMVSEIAKKEKLSNSKTHNRVGFTYL